MRRDGEYLFGRKYFLERSTGTGGIFKVHTACWQEQRILEASLHEQI